MLCYIRFSFDSTCMCRLLQNRIYVIETDVNISFAGYRRSISPLTVWLFVVQLFHWLYRCWPIGSSLKTTFIFVFENGILCRLFHSRFSLSFEFILWLDYVVFSMIFHTWWHIYLFLSDYDFSRCRNSHQWFHQLSWILLNFIIQNVSLQCKFCWRLQKSYELLFWHGND